MTVTDAAKQLGVGRPALSNLLNGRAALSPTMALRLERAFGADRQQLLDLQSRSDRKRSIEADRRVAVQAHVPSFLTITAGQIDNWATGNIRARDQLPVLLRRLVHSTGLDLRHVDFPGYDNSQRPGWDGWIDADAATPWIPKGASGWELSTHHRPGTKADRDFANRLRTVSETERAECTFVFVTARNWPGKDDWAKHKETLGHWKSVRAFDASDLEQWLEASAPGQVWLAEKLGIPLAGLETLDQSWNRWAAASEPTMTAKMFEPAVGEHRSTLTDWLAKPSNRPFAVAADSNDEALAFLYCLFGDSDVPAHHGDRVAVFDSPQTLRTLAAASSTFIPIVCNEETERELVGIYRQRHCIVLRPRNAADREPDIALKPLRHEAFEAALAEMGIDRNDADRWARESGRSPTILRRRLSVIPAIRRPNWARNSEIAQTLIPLVMAGAWHTESSADCEILSALADTDYQQVEESLTRLLDLEDCPVWSVAEHRGVVSKLDALFAIRRSLTGKHVEDFLELAEYVLSEADPSLDLPESDKWAAALYGKVRDHSIALRDGICETLVLLAVHGNDLFERRPGIDVEQRVSSLIERLLKRLTLDKLMSHESDLPRYAEAAPNTFLTLIEDDLKQSESALQGLLRPAGDPLFSSPLRTGLLWALECLAWNPNHLSRVSLVLARLAETKIDDNWANKPIASLAAIYRCWMPQTAASLEERIKGLEMLVIRFPDISWQICIEQFESGTRIGHYSYRPRWRTDAAGAGEVVTFHELNKFACRALDLALAWPDHNSATLGDLIQRLSGMSGDYQAAVWDLVDTWSQMETNESAKAELREQIRRIALARRGQGHDPEAETRARARHAYEQLTPCDPVNRHAWLFASEWIDFSRGELDGEELDFSKREDRIDELRTAAMAEIWTERGFDGTFALLAGTDAAHVVGRYVAPCATRQNMAADVLGICLTDNLDLGQHLDSFMQGFMWAIDVSERETLLLEVASTATTDQKVRLFKCAPFGNQTWRLLDRQSQDVRDAYWREVSPRWNQHSESELNELIDRLLEVKRSWPAFHTVSLAWDKIETSRLKRLLMAVATTVNADDTMAPDAFDISRALDSLDGRPGVTQAEMAQFEFTFIGALREYDGGHAIPNLERQIEDSPVLFVQALALIFKRDDGGDDPREWHIEDPAQRTAVATAAYRLFDRIQRIPGTDTNGNISTENLHRWVTQVRHLCAQYSRVDLGDQYIGRLLSKAPADPDGLWPCRSVCEVMETVPAEHIARGFCIGVYNARGVHFRGEGGDQERELAAKYRAWARQLDFEFPYVSSVLERVAASYDHDAEREDSEANVRQRLGHDY